jgi:hypothetical protein
MEQTLRVGMMTSERVLGGKSAEVGREQIKSVVRKREISGAGSRRSFRMWVSGGRRTAIIYAHAPSREFSLTDMLGLQ